MLDTHVAHWWSAEPDRLSDKAAAAIADAEQLAVAAITWYELAWLATNNRIGLTTTMSSWLDQLSRRLMTVNLTPAVASIAAGLPAAFPKDPADRLIYATAIETGVQLVTKDRSLLEHPNPRSIAIW